MDIYEYYIKVGFDRRDKDFRISRETYEELLDTEEYLLRRSVVGVLYIETVRGAVEINKHEIVFLEVYKMVPTK